MKKSIIIIGFVASIFGCDLGKRTSSFSEPLKTTFQITDTSGHQSTSFNTTDEFDISFTLTNTTNNRIIYHKADSRPIAIFQIFQLDSLIITSVDGLYFLAHAPTEFLLPGQSIQIYWRAPNSPNRNPLIVLSPGSYEVRILVTGLFDGVDIRPISPIAFSIIQ